MPRPTPQVSIRTEGANLCIALPPHGQLITLRVHGCLDSLCRAEDYGAFEPWQGKSFAWINTPDLNRRPTVPETIALPIELVLVTEDVLSREVP